MVFDFTSIIVRTFLQCSILLQCYDAFNTVHIFTAFYMQLALCCCFIYWLHKKYQNASKNICFYIILNFHCSFNCPHYNNMVQYNWIINYHEKLYYYMEGDIRRLTLTKFLSQKYTLTQMRFKRYRKVVKT